MHARFSTAYGDAGSGRPGGRRFGRQALLGLIDHLEAAVEAIEAKHTAKHTAKHKAKHSGPADSWEDLLKNLEVKPDARHNIVQAVDADGNTEWRVRSCYLLANVIGIAPERTNAVHQRRLATVMRKLGWTGPKNIRFGREQAKGYFRTAEEVSP